MKIALFFVVVLVLNQDEWDSGFDSAHPPDGPRLGFEPGLKGWEDRPR